MLAGHAYAGKVGDVNIKLIRLDDASDPSAATRNARKLVEEEKVDVLMGTSGVPGTIAMAVVAAETKTPMISLTPSSPAAGRQRPVADLHSAAAAADGRRRGRADEGGRTSRRPPTSASAIHGATSSTTRLMKNVAGSAIEVVTNERYARADTSVAGQTLKIIAAHPDAVITGGSGTPGALPYLALAERGYKGGLYGTHALINPDFVRVGGAGGRGRDLPDRAGDRRRAIAGQQRHQEGVARVPRRLSEGQQRADHRRLLRLLVRRLAGADRCRQARAGEGAAGHAGVPRGVQGRDASTTKEVVGTHGVYNFKPGSYFGVDERARVLVKLEQGKWKLVQ